MYLRVARETRPIATDTLQHAATHYTTLQHTAPHCNTLRTLPQSYQTNSAHRHRHTATHCNTLSIFTSESPETHGPSLQTHCNILLHTATHCNTLQHTEYLYLRVARETRPIATDPLQHTATHCNTLQHTATHCNTLQHTENLYLRVARKTRPIAADRLAVGAAAVVRRLVSMQMAV